MDDGAIDCNVVDRNKNAGRATHIMPTNKAVAQKNAIFVKKLAKDACTLLMDLMKYLYISVSYTSAHKNAMTSADEIITNASDNTIV